MSIPEPVKLKPKVLEKHVEAYLVRLMKKLGGECYKWASANTRGVPDRICIFPDGLIVFVELKRDRTCKLSPHQLKFAKRMIELNVIHNVVLHGKEEVRQFITDMGY